jgi:hypothetical protein
MRQKHFKKLGEGVWGPHQNASPRLSSTSCSFGGRTSKLSTKHRKDTALDLKIIKQIPHFPPLYVNYKPKIFPLTCTEMIFV